MNFLNPKALWLLIEVIILVLVYIIKTQHEERHISSTFIWKRSEKILKKKLPWQILRRSILFILQIFILILITLISARPTMTITGKGEEWILIIDGSASMQTESEGETRFERAINEASKLANSMKYGNKVTVIYTGDTTSYKITRSDSSLQVVNILEALECSEFSGDFANALSLARLIQQQNEYAKIIYYTDKNFEKSSVSDVSVVNVAKENEWNAAVLSLSQIDQESDKVFMSTIVSYGMDATLTIGLYADGNIIDAKIIDCKAGEEIPVYWTVNNVKDYSYTAVYIEAEDGNKSDNVFYLCKNTQPVRNVMLVSSNPEYMSTLLASFGNRLNVNVFKTLNDAFVNQTNNETGEIPATLSGYSLYIFDGICPNNLPTDGIVWLFGIEHLPDSLGITTTTGLQTAGENTAKILGDIKNNWRISASNNNSNEFCDMLMSYITPDVIAVSSFYAYDSYSDNYEAVLVSKDFLQTGDYPMMLISKDSNIRNVIFSFDIHDSNLPMLVEFPKLVNNMISYAWPTMLEKSEFLLGDIVKISPLPYADSILLTRPNNSESGLVPISNPRPFSINEAGLYTVTQKIKMGGKRSEVTYRFYSHTDIAESNTDLEGGILILDDGIGAPDVFNRSGPIEVWIYLAVALVAVLIAEWWVYYLEQY